MLLSKDQYNRLLGNSLRNCRVALHMSQERFAEAAELGRTHYGAVERGEKSISVYNLYRLLEANGISVPSFFEEI